MDWNALLLAVAATTAGSLFTLYTTGRISRESSRTSARLIYGELTRNSAPIVYYLRAGTWPQSQFDTPVWSQRSEAIAKVKDAQAFNAIYKGYSALEALAFIAQEGDQLGESRQRLMLEEIRMLSEAIHTAGTLAKIEEVEVLQTLEGFTAYVGAGSRGNGSLSTVKAFVPADILRQVIDHGNETEQQAALDTLGSSDPANGLTSTPVGVGPANVDVVTRRIVYTAQGRQDERLHVVARREGDGASGDLVVDEIYDGIAVVSNFYSCVLDLDLSSFTGTPMTALVHYGDKFNNMYWDGGKVVVGDGDGEVFNRFSISVDILAHELSHALVSAVCPLRYANQAGSLTEAVCDVLGVLVKQYQLGQSVIEADWQVGKGLLLSGSSLRSLSAPGTAFDDKVLGKDQQVDHMKNLYRSKQATPRNDWGGIRINAGIPAHAFYLTAVALGGFSWERAGYIWIDAIRDRRLRPTSGFVTFASATIDCARARYGDRSEERDAVEQAWQTVGVKSRVTT